MQDKFILTKPLSKMNKKERKKSRALLIEAFYKEYGPGVFNKLLTKGSIKWCKK